MMPPAEHHGAEADELETGLRLASELYDNVPETPIVVLTSIGWSKIHAGLKGIASVKRVLLKTEYPPSDLVAIVKGIIGDPS